MAQITATFNGTNGSRYQGYLNYSEGTVDYANNRSYIYLSLYIGSNNGAYTFYGYNNYGYIYVDGGQVASGNYTGTVNTNAQLICAWEGWIGHNADGSKSITVGYTINSGYCGTSTASTGWALTDTTTTPTVTTTAISNIDTTTATSGGNVTWAGNGTVSSRGVCWNTTGSPTIANSKTTDGSGTGSFTSSITGLQPDTTYYVRAYATNEVATGYGSQVSFKTTSSGWLGFFI